VLAFALTPAGQASAQYEKQLADNACAYAYSVKTAAQEQRQRAEDKKTAALGFSQVATNGYLARSGTMSPQQLQLFDDAMASASLCYEIGDGCYDVAVLHFANGNQSFAWGDFYYAQAVPQYLTASNYYSSSPQMGFGGGAATHYGYAYDEWTHAETAYHQALLNYAIAYDQTNPP
jgi:hypothetical protein